MLNKPPMIQNARMESPGRIMHSNLRNKSLFNPQVHNNEHIEVFGRMVVQELDQLKI